MKSDSGLGVNLIDTSGLYDELIMPAEDCDNIGDAVPTFHEGQANFYKTIGMDQPKPTPVHISAEVAAERSQVKSHFQKSLRNLQGGLIPLELVRQRLRSSTSAFVEPWAVPDIQSLT